jgi:hypothetical protein
MHRQARTRKNAHRRTTTPKPQAKVHTHARATLHARSVPLVGAVHRMPRAPTGLSAPVTADGCRCTQHARAGTRVEARTQTHTEAQTCALTRARTHPRSHPRARAHAHAHTHARTRSHTHTHAHERTVARYRRSPLMFPMRANVPIAMKCASTHHLHRIAIGPAEEWAARAGFHPSITRFCQSSGPSRVPRGPRQARRIPRPRAVARGTSRIGTHASNGAVCVRVGVCVRACVVLCMCLCERSGRAL